jgi:hypothetical protein
VTIHAMDETSTTVVTLKIESGAKPISGWIEAGRGDRRRFVGMLELIGALDAIRLPPEAEAPVADAG